MKKSQSDNQTGNQVVFRGRNEKTYSNIREFNETAKDQDQHPVKMTGNEFLYFFCECSDENCVIRTKVTFSDYEKHHKDRASFIVLPDHVVPEIENVIERNENYWVVKKHKDPSQTTSKLRASGLNHNG